MKNEQSQTDTRIDEWMGTLLRSGVTLAALMVLAGGGVYLWRHEYPPVNYRVFEGEPEMFRSLGGIWHAAIAGSGRGLIQLGLLVLIATPVARVVFSVLAFLYQRDWKYVGFTLVVLTLLLYSVFR